MNPIRVFALIFVMSVFNVFAVTEPGSVTPNSVCEEALVEDPFYRLVEKAVESGLLGSEDVTRLASAEVVVNPLVSRTKQNPALLRGFEQQLKAMTPERWAGLRKAFAELVKRSGVENSARAESREETASILRVRRVLELPIAHVLEWKWVNEGGQNVLVVSAPNFDFPRKYQIFNYPELNLKVVKALPQFLNVLSGGNDELWIQSSSGSQRQLFDVKKEEVVQSRSARQWQGYLKGHGLFSFRIRANDLSNGLSLVASQTDSRSWFKPAQKVRFATGPSESVLSRILSYGTSLGLRHQAHILAVHSTEKFVYIIVERSQYPYRELEILVFDGQTLSHVDSIENVNIEIGVAGDSLYIAKLRSILPTKVITGTSVKHVQVEHIARISREGSQAILALDSRDSRAFDLAQLNTDGFSRLHSLSSSILNPSSFIGFLTFRGAKAAAFYQDGRLHLLDVSTSEELGSVRIGDYKKVELVADTDGNPLLLAIMPSDKGGRLEVLTLFSPTRGPQSEGGPRVRSDGNCEEALVEDPFYRLVEKALKTGLLGSEDVVRLASAEAAVNPLVSRTKQNPALLRALEQQVKTMTPERWAGIRVALDELATRSRGENSARAESREETAPLLRVRKLLELPYRRIHNWKWIAQNGENVLAVSTPATGDPSVDHQVLHYPKLNLKLVNALPGDLNLISGKENELWVESSLGPLKRELFDVKSERITKTYSAGSWQGYLEAQGLFSFRIIENRLTQRLSLVAKRSSALSFLIPGQRRRLRPWPFQSSIPAVFLKEKPASSIVASAEIKSIFSTGKLAFIIIERSHYHYPHKMIEIFRFDGKTLERVLELDSLLEDLKIVASGGQLYVSKKWVGNWIYRISDTEAQYIPVNEYFDNWYLNDNSELIVIARDLELDSIRYLRLDHEELVPIFSLTVPKLGGSSFLGSSAYRKRQVAVFFQKRNGILRVVDIQGDEEIFSQNIGDYERVELVSGADGSPLLIAESSQDIVRLEILSLFSAARGPQSVGGSREVSSSASREECEKALVEDPFYRLVEKALETGLLGSEDVVRLASAEAAVNPLASRTKQNPALYRALNQQVATMTPERWEKLRQALGKLATRSQDEHSARAESYEQTARILKLEEVTPVLKLEKLILNNLRWLKDGRKTVMMVSSAEPNRILYENQGLTVTNVQGHYFGAVSSSADNFYVKYWNAVQLLNPFSLQTVQKLARGDIGVAQVGALGRFVFNVKVKNDERTLRARREGSYAWMPFAPKVKLPKFLMVNQIVAGDSEAYITTSAYNGGMQLYRFDGRVFKDLELPISVDARSVDGKIHWIGNKLYLFLREVLKSGSSRFTFHVLDGDEWSKFNEREEPFYTSEFWTGASGRLGVLGLTRTEVVLHFLDGHDWTEYRAALPSGSFRLIGAFKYRGDDVAVLCDKHSNQLLILDLKSGAELATFPFRVGRDATHFSLFQGPDGQVFLSAEKDLDHFSVYTLLSPAIQGRGPQSVGDGKEPNSPRSVDNCEGALVQDPFHKLIARTLTKQVLRPEDVALFRGLEQQLAAMTPERWLAIRGGLAQLVNQSHVDNSARAESRERPRNLSDSASRGPSSEKPEPDCEVELLDPFARLVVRAVSKLLLTLERYETSLQGEHESGTLEWTVLPDGRVVLAHLNTQNEPTRQRSWLRVFDLWTARPRTTNRAPQSVNQSGDDEDCEVALTGDPVLRLLDLAYKKQLLPLDRLQGLEQSDRPLNPFRSLPTTVDNHAIRVVLDNELGKMTSERWQSIRARLRSWLKKISVEEVAREKSREHTQPILRPRLVGKLPLEVGNVKAINWIETKGTTGRPTLEVQMAAPYQNRSSNVQDVTVIERQHNMYPIVVGGRQLFFRPHGLDRGVIDENGEVVAECRGGFTAHLVRVLSRGNLAYILIWDDNFHWRIFRFEGKTLEDKGSFRASSMIPLHPYITSRGEFLITSSVYGDFIYHAADGSTHQIQTGIKLGISHSWYEDAAGRPVYVTSGGDGSNTLRKLTEITFDGLSFRTATLPIRVLDDHWNLQQIVVPDGPTYYAFGVFRGPIQFFDVPTGKNVATLPIANQIDGLPIQVFPDGRILMAVLPREFGEVQIYDLWGAVKDP